LVGLAKVLSTFGWARILYTADPLIGFPYREMLFVVGLTEVGIGFLCLFAKERKAFLLAVTWLSTSFVVYLPSVNCSLLTEILCGFGTSEIAPVR
jgi:hypothetical protein